MLIPCATCFNLCNLHKNFKPHRDSKINRLQTTLCVSEQIMRISNMQTSIWHNMAQNVWFQGHMNQDRTICQFLKLNGDLKTELCFFIHIAKKINSQCGKSVQNIKKIYYVHLLYTSLRTKVRKEAAMCSNLNTFVSLLFKTSNF